MDFIFQRLCLLLLGILPLMGLAQDVPLKRLYLGNDTHVDIMYNGTEEKWAQLILDMADFYLKLGEGTENLEPARRSKWNYDCAYWLYVLENRTSPEYFARIIAQLKKQQASVPFNFTLPIYGGSTAEGVLRSFYYSGYLERKYGLDIDLAVCQENATMPLGLTSLFAGAGAKYSWKGVCNCATKTKTIGLRRYPIYWSTGLDSSKILMKWYSSAGWNAELGGYAEMLEPTIAVMQMDTLCGSKHYPYRIAGAFGRGWDNMVNYAYDVQWGIDHRTRPGTKVFVSNEIDFFEDFAKTYGSQLPGQAVAYGNEWDLLPASLMSVSGGIRRALERLRTSEALASLVFTQDSTAFRSLANLKKDAYYAISLISAHGWTTDGSITKSEFAKWAKQQLSRIETYTDSLHKVAGNALGKMIQDKSTENVFVVFNSLSWERSELVEVPINGDVEVVELESSQTVPSHKLERGGKRYLQFIANKVPSLGYRGYALRPRKTNQPSRKLSSPFKYANNILETPFYRVKMANSGAILSLIDKKTGKELVRPVNGTYPNSLGTDLGGTIAPESESPYSITLLAKGKNPLSYSTRITFYKSFPQIDFDNQIEDVIRQPTYWHYSFNIDKPTVWHEEVGAVIKAKYESAGGHYADDMSRVDHLTINHFADMSNPSGGITLSDSDCLFMQLGQSEPQKLDTETPQFKILAGGQIDGPSLGIKDQDGDSVLQQHFSLLPHAKPYHQTEAMKFSLAHQNPLAIIDVHGGTAAVLPNRSFSFLRVQQPDVLVWSLKPAEELNAGLAVRLWNMGGKPSETELQFALPIQQAQAVSLVETPIETLPHTKNSVQIGLRQQQMRSVTVRF